MERVTGTWRNLSGEIIRFAVMEEKGIAELTIKPSDTAIQYNETHYVTGYTIDLLQDLGFILSFPMPSVTFVDSFFPNSTSNAVSEATWNGTAAELLHANETDIIGGFLYMLPVRSRIANALWPLSNERFEVYFRQPDLAPYDYNPFTKQFSSDLAAAIILVMIISAVLLASVHSLCKWEMTWDFRWKNLLFDYLRQFYDTLFWAVGTWCQQGSDLISSKWQARLLMLSVSNFFVFMYLLYCALIIATLTQEIIPVKRVDQLFRFQYTFFTSGDAKSRLFIENETNLFWNPPSSSFTNYDYEKGLSIQRIFTHRHAHLDTADLFYSDLHSQLANIPGFTKNDVCDVLSVLPYKGGNLQGGMYARKGFKFRKEFNYAFSRIREAGISFRVLRMYEAIKIDRCPEEKTYYQEDLGMSYVGSSFVGLAMLYFGAGVIFIFEFLMLQKNRCKSGS